MYASSRSIIVIFTFFAFLLLIIRYLLRYTNRDYVNMSREVEENHGP